MSPIQAMEEDPSSGSSSVSRSVNRRSIFSDPEGHSKICAQYLDILTYFKDSKSIDGLYACLGELQEKNPDDYKRKLNKFYAQTLNSHLSSKVFARRIRKFIENERRRLRRSPLLLYDDDFFNFLEGYLQQDGY